jgi:hypothetical protein
MCRANRKFFNTTLLLFALFGISTAIAHAQITESGFVTPEDSDAFVAAGQQTGITTNITCSIQTVEPTVTFFVSSSPNTAGTEIGSYTINTQTGFVWTPTVTGTQFISAFLNLNGATGCTGGPVSSDPTTIEIIVD